MDSLVGITKSWLREKIWWVVRIRKQLGNRGFQIQSKYQSSQGRRGKDVDWLFGSELMSWTPKGGIRLLMIKSGWAGNRDIYTTLQMWGRGRRRIRISRERMGCPPNSEFGGMLFIPSLFFSGFNLFRLKTICVQRNDAGKTCIRIDGSGSRRAHRGWWPPSPVPPHRSSWGASSLVGRLPADVGNILDLSTPIKRANIFIVVRFRAKSNTWPCESYKTKRLNIRHKFKLFSGREGNGENNVSSTVIAENARCLLWA